MDIKAKYKKLKTLYPETPSTIILAVHQGLCHS
jgi:hypothetical protein